MNTEDKTLVDELIDTIKREIHLKNGGVIVKTFNIRISAEDAKTLGSLQSKSMKIWSSALYGIYGSKRVDKKFYENIVVKGD